jgi:hypothetical protein
MTVFRSYECTSFDQVRKTIQDELRIYTKALQNAANKENIANFTLSVADEVINSAQENLINMQPDFIWRGHLTNEFYPISNNDGSASIVHGYDIDAFMALEFGYEPHWVRSDRPTGMGETVGDWYVWFVTAGGGGDEEMQRKAERIGKGEVVPIHVMNPVHAPSSAGKFFHPAAREVEQRMTEKLGLYFKIHVEYLLESK